MRVIESVERLSTFDVTLTPGPLPVYRARVQDARSTSLPICGARARSWFAARTRTPAPRGKRGFRRNFVLDDRARA